MSSCSSCSSCGGHCEPSENGCPHCGVQGIEVPTQTVKSLAKDFLKDQIPDEQFRLCINKACNVAYYTEDKMIHTNQIKKSIWYKRDADQYTICYCRDITLDDIVKAVEEMEVELNKKNVIKHLGKDNIESNCIENNPTGQCCTPLFDNAIKYALQKINDK